MRPESNKSGTWRIASSTNCRAIAPVFQRATEVFPAPVRTLDAIHLATMAFLRERVRDRSVASCDARMLEAARAMDFAVYDLQARDPPRTRQAVKGSRPAPMMMAPAFR
jgi:hypothetical protein